MFPILFSQFQLKRMFLFRGSDLGPRYINVFRSPPQKECQRTGMLSYFHVWAQDLHTCLMGGRDESALSLGIQFTYPTAGESCSTFAVQAQLLNSIFRITITCLLQKCLLERAGRTSDCGVQKNPKTTKLQKKKKPTTKKMFACKHL